MNYLSQQAADIFFVSGRFTPLYGYERSLNFPNGHRNVMFAKRGVPLRPSPLDEKQAKTGAQALYAYLRKHRGIAVSHTSATGMGTDWRDNDPEVEPLVEIYQGDRVSAEHEGAPKAATRSDPTSLAGDSDPRVTCGMRGQKDTSSVCRRAPTTCPRISPTHAPRPPGLHARN